MKNELDSTTLNIKEEFMRAALKEALIADSEDEIPVGAVIVYQGEIIARAHNEKEKRKNATAHAEILAIERACIQRDSWRLDGTEMYVTMEPCAMCAGALINSRISKLFYGTPDLRFGACGSIYSLPDDSRFNHTLSIEGGILKDECLDLLQAFFKRLRKRNGYR